MNPARKPATDEVAPSDLERAEALKRAFDHTLSQLRTRIVGQEEVLTQLVTALLASGHCLLEGYPGLGKTLLVRSVAETLSMSFSRVQFTPDLMPSDVIGAEILEPNPVTQTIERKLFPGPIFTNVLLADEINRTPPKTQSSLLEAMQEGQVTIGLESLPLPKPFFVLATQNPIEQEGTYRLPEAQLDRFLFKIDVQYPDAQQEIEIARNSLRSKLPEVVPVLDAKSVLEFQEWITGVPVPDHVYEFCARLVRSSRPTDECALAGVTDRWIEVGAGPRATIALIRAAQAYAVLHGEFHVSVPDVQAIAKPVLRHRLLMSFDAQAEGQSPDQVVDALLAAAPVA